MWKNHNFLVLTLLGQFPKIIILLSENAYNGIFDFLECAEELWELLEYYVNGGSFGFWSKFLFFSSVSTRRVFVSMCMEPSHSWPCRWFDCIIRELDWSYIRESCGVIYVESKWEYVQVASSAESAWDVKFLNINNKWVIIIGTC